MQFFILRNLGVKIRVKIENITLNKLFLFLNIQNSLGSYQFFRFFDPIPKKHLMQKKVKTINNVLSFLNTKL